MGQPKDSRPTGFSRDLSEASENRDGGEWNARSQRQVISGRDVHVWRWSLTLGSGHLGRWFDLLSDEEQKRAARFHFQVDRERFVVARGCMRMLLAGYLDQPPERIRFRYGTHGKPELDISGTGSFLQFNLSHSHEIALCALARGRRVGVDVEKVARESVDGVAIADKFFTTEEAQKVRSARPEARAEVFLRIWTRKEAYLKGLGEGITSSLNQFNVSLEDSMLRSATGADEAPNWSLHELYPYPGFIAAVAVEGGCDSLTLLDFSSPDGDRDAVAKRRKTAPN